MENPRRIREGKQMLSYFQNLLTELHKAAEGEDLKTAEKSRVLLRRYEAPVLDAMSALRISGSPVRWFFSAPTGKKKAVAAFHYLFDVRTLGLGPEAEAILSRSKE